MTIRRAIPILLLMALLIGITPVSAQDDTPANIMFEFVQLAWTSTSEMYAERFALAQIRLFERRWRAAEAEFDHLIELDPNDVYAYIGRAEARFQQRDRLAAFLDLDRAADIDANVPEIYAQKANFFIRTNGYSNADLELTHAIRLDRTFAGAYLLRALTGISQGYIEASIADASTVIALEPNNPWGYLMRGAIYYVLEEPSPALRDLKAGASMMGLSTPPTLLDTILELESQVSSEMAYAEPTPTLASPIPEQIEEELSDWVIANELLDQFNFVLAIDMLSQVISQNPDNVAAYYWRGWSHYYLGEYDDAIANADMVIGLLPDEPSGFFLRMNIYTMLRNPESVYLDADRVIQRDPNREIKEAYFWRGSSATAWGDYQAALEDFDRFRALHPDYIPPAWQDAIYQVEQIVNGTGST